MKDYREALAWVKDQLSSEDNGRELDCVVIQRRPYTVAIIGTEARGKPELLGVGFAKVNSMDPWDAEYGVAMALRKAMVDTAKRMVGRPSYLRIGRETVEVPLSVWRGRMPAWLLEYDLNAGPKDLCRDGD